MRARMGRALFILACGWFFAAPLLAAEANDENEAHEWVEGTVKIQKNEAGKVVGITIEAMEWDENDNAVNVVYNVVKNAKSKRLEGMDGKRVEINGTIETKGNGKNAKKWITVISIEELQTEKEETQQTDL
jgi:uncharacterized protein YuzE